MRERKKYGIRASLIAYNSFHHGQHMHMLAVDVECTCICMMVFIISLTSSSRVQNGENYKKNWKVRPNIASSLWQDLFDWKCKRERNNAWIWRMEIRRVLKSKTIFPHWHNFGEWSPEFACWEHPGIRRDKPKGTWDKFMLTSIWRKKCLPYWWNEHQQTE